MSPERIRQLLIEKGLKITPQRLVITDFLVHTESHPSADEVYEAVRDRLPACSLATIYNTLKSLAEAGVVCTVATEPGKIRYDANMHAHHHFVDTRTGTIYDIPWNRIDQLCDSLGEGFKVKDYQITFYGEYSSSK